MSAQAKVADDRGAQPADILDDGRRLGPHARSPRGDDAPQPVAAFEDQDAEARLRQVGARYQAVVSSADDHRVVSRGTVRHAALRDRRADFMACMAAILPGAPMIPPPGCVAEPHIQRLRMGVR